MTYVGIDPGLTGAIACITGKSVLVFPTPTLSLGGAKRDYDIPGMARRLLFAGEDGAAIAWIERAQPMRHKGKDGARVEGTVSSFRSGYGYGVWHGLLTALDIPYHVVAARSWQRAMLVGVNKSYPKAASVLVAKRLFPAVSLLRTDRCRVDHDGMADALLIAEFGRRSRVIE